LCDASRNEGEVQLVRDQVNDQLVAVKRMPNKWICKSHEDFLRSHPGETELPWQDVGCTQFLNSVNYEYACKVHGVFRDDTNTYVMFEYAPGGDLFDLALAGRPAGKDREESFAPIVGKVCSALKILHELEIAHRDVSLENVLLAGQSANSEIRLIDFSMASRDRMFSNNVRGKPSYQAPEMHDRGAEYDAFLSDTFALGVLVYCVFLGDYPWMSTKPGGCMHFEYFKKNSFRSYANKRMVRGKSKRIGECISDPLFQLLDGLLALEPHKRLTLGEKQFGPRRRSVWDEPWMKSHPLRSR